MTEATASSWAAQVANAAVRFDWAEVSAVIDAYVEYLNGADDAPEAGEVLAQLRRNRRMDDLVRAADALLAHPACGVAAELAVAQALVDRGLAAAALPHFRAIRDRFPPSSPECAEARGGIGRCHKDLFLRRRPRADRARQLNAAYQAYRSAYAEDDTLVWHGVNAVALLARAEREGIAIDSLDPADSTTGLAQRVAETVAGSDGYWGLAIACECAIALGRDALAVARAAELAVHPDVGAFELGAFVRQLTTVWELTADQLPGSVLLPMLHARLLQLDGGGFRIDAGQVRAERASTGGLELEAVLGTTRFLSLPWYRKGLARCAAVARIETVNGQGIGTGFLVDGRDLHDGFDGPLLVTNAHVVPEDLPADMAVVVFHGLDERDGRRREFRPREVVWTDASDGPGLDTTVLRLDGYPEGVPPVPLAHRLPNLAGEGQPRAYLIGHPRGLETPQFSLQDNAILGYDEVRLHYRSPTEPGSSGSPVFDGDWRLLGLHHGGGGDVPRLKGAGGTYAANEAILVSAIRERIRERGGAGSTG